MVVIFHFRAKWIFYLAFPVGEGGPALPVDEV
jgi:hypothetical protein